MRKLLNKIINWALRYDVDDISEDQSYARSPAKRPRRSSNAMAAIGVSSGSIHAPNFGETNTAFHFVVYQASGGKAIQCYYYDENKDRTMGNIYVIHNNDDLGHELSMILSKECLSR